MATFKMFQDWQNNPVLTTVKSSAFPIKDISFPTVTICGQGLSSDILQAGFFHEFFKYLKSIGHDMGISPIRAVKLLNKVINK